MRNGFNTAGFSEVVHEIKRDPAEARFVYSAKGRRSELTGLTVQILPALLGTVKSPRKFSFSLQGNRISTPLNEESLFNPMDLFLTGIGACMMTTLVGGASARHLALESALLDLAPLLSSNTESCITTVSASFILATTSEDERCEQLVERVTQQSPNYVTLTSATSVTISSIEHSSPALQTVKSSMPCVPIHFDGLTVDWISGTQCLALPSEKESASPLRVDAPKQLTGVDWGPNPQEYLLAGLAAEIPDLLFKHSIGTPFEGHAWEAIATGVEDVRGFLGVSSEIAVGLQEIEVSIKPPTGVSESFDNIASRAILDSQIIALLVKPTKISLSWQRATRVKSTKKLPLRPGVGE